MQRITPFLWFDNNAEEAANFYVSVFNNAKLLNVARYGDAEEVNRYSARTKVKSEFCQDVQGHVSAFSFSSAGRTIRRRQRQCVGPSFVR